MTNRRFIATLIVGALFGSAVVIAMRGHDLDLLYLELAKCKDSAQQLLEEKTKLEQDLTHAEKLKDRRLRKFNIVVEKAPDEFTKLAVQKQVKLQLRPLLDKNLALLEDQPALIKNLLEHREYEITTQKVTVTVNAVFIGETTTLYLNAVKEESTVQPTDRTTVGTPLP